MVRGGLAAGALALAGVAASQAPALFLDRVPTQTELGANFTGAKFEPRQGCILGAYIDLDSSLKEVYKDGTGVVRRMPDAFEKLTGRKHASYFFYLGYGRPAPVDWITLLGMEKRAVHIALEPNNGLEFVKDNSYLRKLAKDFEATKTPIFLRFASEMNGDWLPWHGDPAAYIEKFRLVAKVMREEAPNVALVWCPYATPATNIRDYYPGDEHVDWVGVNIYNVTYFNQNRRTPGKQVGPTELLDPVYNWFAGRKPIMIGEYGATHYSRVEDRSVPEFAAGCIRSLYSALPRKYPRVKAVFYFNTNNMELAHARNNNYAVTQHPDVLRVYRSMVSEPWFLSSFDPSRLRDTMAQPMPIRPGEVLTGVARLSGWAPIHKGEVRLRIRIDGKVAATAPDVSGWMVSLDTTQFEPGPAVLEAEVIADGRVRSRSRVRVVIDNPSESSR